MHHVQIPDPLYVELQRAAEANGVTVESFVREAVQLYLHEKPETGSIQLTPRQVAIIRKGQAEIKAGKFLTSEQVKAELNADKAAWLQANPH
jgi:predicted transcriptional regulator